jgi:hypothetical protein
MRTTARDRPWQCQLPLAGRRSDGGPALKDSATGRLARKDEIRAGVDHIRVNSVGGGLTLGELMARCHRSSRETPTAMAR